MSSKAATHMSLEHTYQISLVPVLHDQLLIATLKLTTYSSVPGPCGLPLYYIAVTL